MGLDVIAYSKLRSTEDYTEITEPAVRLCENPDYPDHTDDLRSGEFYFYDDKNESRFGPYASYDDWMDSLAHMAFGVGGVGDVRRNAEQYRNGPFFELFSFSNRHGFIGPRTSAKLAKDFKEHAEAAEKFAAKLGEEEGDDFLSSYREMRDSFELAADGGAVVFT